MAASGKHIGESTHTLDALVSTSGICDEAQKQALHTKLHNGLDDGTILGLTIHWNHDATPLHVMFGHLQGLVYKAARYLVKDGARWKAVSYEGFREESGIALPRSGIFEILAQLVSVHWLTGGPVQTKVDLEVLLSPTPLQTTSSSCLHNACNTSLEDLSVQGLHDIGRKVLLFILA